MRAQQAAKLLGLFFLVSCDLMGGDTSNVKPITVESFTFTSSNEAEGRFNWQVSAPGAGRLECRLDTDDDGRAEYVMDCSKQEQPHTYSEAGPYTATLTAEDAQGRKKTAKREVQIKERSAEQAPKPSFVMTPQSGPAPLNITVDASSSEAPKGSSYRWDFGDGTTGIGLQAAHTYKNVGNYQVTLTVSYEGRGAEHVETVQVTEARANAPTKLTWQKVANAPIDRHEAFGGFAADGKLYVFGGYNVSTAEPTFKPTRRVDAYDPATNTWEQRQDLPVGLSHAGTAVAGEAIYFAGGYPEASNSLGQSFTTNKVWQYNVSTDTYTPLPDLPARYGGGALALLDGILYYYGGSDRNRNDTNDHWVLPLDGSATWTPAAGLPLPRNHLGSAVIDGKIYAVGGQSGQDGGATYHAEVSVYDPATDTWTAVAALPRALSHNNASTFAMEGRIIVLGGEYAYLKSIDNAYAYDPKTDRWSELTDLPLPKNAGVGGHTGGALYHVTGSTSVDAFKGVFVD